MGHKPPTNIKEFHKGQRMSGMHQNGNCYTDAKIFITDQHDLFIVCTDENRKIANLYLKDFKWLQHFKGGSND